MNKKTCFFTSGIFFIAFIVLIILLKTYDVDGVGPLGTSVGFSHFNVAVRDFVGTSSVWYLISKLLGIGEIALGAAFIAFGVYIVFKSKGAGTISKPHFCGMFVLAAMFAFYVLFELIEINYRPIIEEGATVPEASFPSTHTMIAITVMGVLAEYVKSVAQNQKTVRVLYLACVVIAFAAITSRVLSGVHWATDICGGLLIGSALLFFYKGLIGEIESN